MTFKVLLAAAAVLAASTAHAITYTFDYSVGDGHVTGVLETDGTLGAITLDQVVDYSFTLSSPTFSSSLPKMLTSANSMTADLGSGYFLATTTELSFDFSSSDALGVAFFELGTGSDALFCLVSAGPGGCGRTPTVAGSGAAILSRAWTTSNAADVSSYGDADAIAAAPIPLPAGFPLLAAGLGAMVFLRRRTATA